MDESLNDYFDEFEKRETRQNATDAAMKILSSRRFNRWQALNLSQVEEIAWELLVKKGYAELRNERAEGRLTTSGEAEQSLLEASRAHYSALGTILFHELGKHVSEKEPMPGSSTQQVAKEQFAAPAPPPVYAKTSDWILSKKLAGKRAGVTTGNLTSNRIDGYKSADGSWGEDCNGKWRKTEPRKNAEVAYYVPSLKD